MVTVLIAGAAPFRAGDPLPQGPAREAARGGAAGHAAARPVPLATRTTRAGRRSSATPAAGVALRLRLVRALAVAPRDGVSLEDLRARLRSSDRVQRVEDDGPIAHRQETPTTPASASSTRSSRRTTTTSTRPAPGASGRAARRWRCSTPACRATIPTCKGNLWENTKDPSNGKRRRPQRRDRRPLRRRPRRRQGLRRRPAGPRDARRRDHRRARQQRPRHRRACAGA